MGELKEMCNQFLLCWVTKLAVSVLHVSRLCQLPGGGSACEFAVSKEMVITEQQIEHRMVGQHII